MKSFTILFFFIISSVLFAQSPYTNVMIDNVNHNGYDPEEPSICINPKNTNILVAGSNINNVHYSTNSGLNWTTIPLVSTYTVWGDPAITVDTNGVFYYFHLVNGTGFIDRMGCQKSTNNGATWSAGTFYQFNPPKQQDKEWPCVDWTHGPRGNTIYVTWTQFDSYGSTNSNDSSIILFTKSTDGGSTFAASQRINQKAGDCVDADYTMEGAVPCIGPNGEVYVGWAGPSGINNFKIFFTRTTDGGATWLPNNIIASTQRGGWDYFISNIYRANGLPITCCDISNGPYRGTIYINYTDSVTINDHDVMLVKSTNGGLNWSAPIKINDDNTGREQFFSWLTIDQATGYLYCVFYDRRNYSNNVTTDVFLARSSDGGTTWVNERISATSFNPNPGPFFGDYTNITAYNGHVRPIWARLDGQSTSIWTAIIDFPVAVNQISNGVPSSFNLYQNYPNPFNPATKIKFDIAGGLPNKGLQPLVQLNVYDIIGKKVVTLVNDKLNAGTYEIEWSASDYPSGVYYYKLVVGDNTNNGNYSQTKKLVLIK